MRPLASIRRAKALELFALSLLISACTAPPKTTTQPATTQSANAQPARPTKELLLADFESPDPPVTWLAATPATQSTTNPDTQPSPPALRRSSQNPHTGLWSLANPAAASGSIHYTFAQPIDLSDFNLLSAQISHTGPAARNAEYSASLILTDSNGKSIAGDQYPVLSAWQPIPMNLQSAYEDGLDLSHIAAIDIKLRRNSSAAQEDPLLIQTDTWRAQQLVKKYIGDRTGQSKSFFVETESTFIRVGSVDQYQLILSDHGGAAPGNPAPTWMEVITGGGSITPTSRQIIGQPNTGLFLLDQSALDSFSKAPGGRRQDSDDAAPRTALGALQPWQLPTSSWPASLNPELSTIHWQVAWSSPIAAIIEGTQTAGPYDSLGEPAATVTWRLMVYQWGQVFVHAHWTKSTQSQPSVSDPVSWALVLPEIGSGNIFDNLSSPADNPQERLLTDIYPATFRVGPPPLQTALPHRMQSTSRIGMIARTSPQKNTWWWASAPLSTDSSIIRRYLGAGIPSNPGTALTDADCMLLLNAPDHLTKAASFGQYLVPPKIILKQGELDLTIPGDVDQDGFVEPYGYQAIRLSSGRASFTVYPQERPIFYPAFLFVIPAVERNTLDLAHSRILVNVDGKLFSDLPQFPDGSFLLQLPYVLNRPVQIQAELVKR